jgi:hypothetical protein
MATPKKYFHDRLVLLLLSINAFLALAGSVIILLRDIDPSGTFAVQYRARLGLNAFTSGGATEIYSFALFSVVIFAFHFYLSRKAYPIRRHFAIAVLGMATLLLTLSILVSNALLLY